MMAVDFTVSYGPRRNHSKYFLRWVDVLLTCLWACTSVNASYECVCVCASVSDSCSLRKLRRHCEDSAGSSAPFVFARSSFPPTAGRRAGTVGIQWMTWVERQAAIRGSINGG